MNPLRKLATKLRAIRGKRNVAPVAQLPQPGTMAHAQWKAWLNHQSIYKAPIDFDDFVAQVWDSEGYAHMLSKVLHRAVHRRPENVERDSFSSTLNLIEQLYPDQKEALIHEAFFRVLEEAAHGKDTWAVEQFIAAGASTDWAWCLINTIWHAQYEFEKKRPQVVAVMRRLLEAGADPDKEWPELENLSAREILGGRMKGWDRKALEVLEEAEQPQVLDRLTVPAMAVAKARRI